MKPAERRCCSVFSPRCLFLITIRPTVGRLCRRLRINSSPFPPQPSTTSCPRGRYPGGPTPTSHRRPTWCPSRSSPPRTRPIRASAARTTEASELSSSSFTSPGNRRNNQIDRQVDRENEETGRDHHFTRARTSELSSCLVPTL